MIECKFCGYTSNEGEFNFCPKCGKSLSSSPEDLKSKKAKKAAKKAEKVAKSEKSAEKKKKFVVIDPFKKRKTRVSYVIFGILALILGLGAIWLYGDLFLGGTIGTKWAENFAKKFNKWVSFGGIREKVLKKLYFSALAVQEDSVLTVSELKYEDIADINQKGAYLVGTFGKEYSFMLFFVGIVFVLNLFSLFTGKQNTSSIFFKFSELFTTLAIVLCFIAHYFTENNILTKIVEMYDKFRWIIWLACAGLGAVNLLLGIFCSFSKKRVYRSTFYQFWKALFWLVVVAMWTVILVDKIKIPDKIVDICGKWYFRILFAIPVHLLLCALFMFASSRHSKKASQMMK